MAFEASDLPIHTSTLDNGLQLVFEPMPWLATASFTLLLPFGSATDPAGQEGSATVLADWLQRGAGPLDSRAFSDALDDLGARRGGGAGREATTFGASLLADAVPEALGLYADLARRPQLADEEFEPARALALEELASLTDNPVQRLFDHLLAHHFTSGQGRSPYGSDEGLNAMTPASLRADRGRRVGPQGAVLAIAGGVTWERVRAAVEAAFGPWRGNAEPLPAPEARAGGRHHVTADTAQTQIGFAFEAVDADHPAWYAQALAVGVLSGGMGSRLFSEVREKRGLVYSVSAMTRTLRGYGYTLGYAGTTPERATETLEVMLAEFERLRDGVSAAELERARTGLLADLVMQGESSAARAGALAHDVFLRGSPRRLADIRRAVGGVTLEQVNAFVAEHPLRDPSVLTLGPTSIGAPA